MHKAIGILLTTLYVGLTVSTAFAQTTAQQQKDKWSGKQRTCVETGNCPK
jgi:hypothetical protein